MPQKGLLTGVWCLLYFCHKALKMINDTGNGLVVWVSYIALEIYRQLIGICLSYNTPGPVLIAVDFQLLQECYLAQILVLTEGVKNHLLSLRQKQFVRNLQVLCLQWPIKVLKYSPAEPPGSSYSLKWWTNIKLLLGFYYQLQITKKKNPTQISVLLWLAHFPCLAINPSHIQPCGACAKRSL